jgi:hypothetical protein
MAKSLCVISLVLLAIASAGRVCNAKITCKTVMEENPFPATSDSSGCAILDPPELVCPKGYTATGGGCACADCGPLENDKPKDVGWKCDYNQIDDTGTLMCLGSADVVTFVVCCK